MDYLAEKFARLGTDNAPGQEGLQKAEDLPMIGDKLEGPAVDFSHGDVNAHQPIPGSLETFVKHYCVDGTYQAYTEYRGKGAIREYLAEKLAEYSGAPVDPKTEIILTPGTQGALFLAMGSLVGRGDKVAIVEPDYFDNRKLVEFFEGEMVPIHMNWKDAAPHTSGIDLKELEEAFKNGVKLFLYSNPNNPTGAVFSKEEVSEIARLAKKYDVAILADELYSRQILEKADLKETVLDMASHIVDRSMDMYAPKEAYSEDWDVKSLISYAEEFYAPAGFLKEEKLQEMSRDELETFLHKVAVDYYNAREENNTAPIMRELENLVMLKVVDSHWMEHLDAMDALREGIGLRAYGQRDPLVEYKFEAYEMFEAMKEAIVDDVVRYMYRVNVVTQPVVEDHLSEASTNNPNVDGSTETPKEPVRNDSTVGRNDPCPCGSGKKYKNCCGKNQNS